MLISCLIFTNFKLYFLFLFFVFLSFCLLRAAPVAHGDSQARGFIAALAAGLGRSHSNARSELRL